MKPLSPGPTKCPSQVAAILKVPVCWLLQALIVKVMQLVLITAVSVNIAIIEIIIHVFCCMHMRKKENNSTAI